MLLIRGMTSDMEGFDGMGHTLTASLLNTVSTRYSKTKSGFKDV